MNETDIVIDVVIPNCPTRCFASRSVCFTVIIGLLEANVTLSSTASSGFGGGVGWGFAGSTLIVVQPSTKHPNYMCGEPFESERTPIVQSASAAFEVMPID